MKKTSILFAALVAATISLYGCKDDDNPVDTPSDPVSAAISADVKTVIIPSYNTLHDKGDALGDALTAFKASATEVNLAAAKQAWIDARKAWESCEAFGFGPVSNDNVDPDVDDWPFDTASFNQILNSSTPLTQDYINSMETNLKGFHAIEYLLYGINSDKPLSAFTARELDMLSALGTNVSSRLHDLATAWSSSGSNFGDNLLNPPNSTYANKTAVLAELIDGVTGSTNEVANEKIGIPLESHDENDDESRYSKNSTNDFANNIIGARNIYLGTLDGSSGNGLTLIIRKNSTALDDSVKTAITNALAKINAMTPTFVDALSNNPSAVQAAKDAVSALDDILTNRVGPILKAQ